MISVILHIEVISNGTKFLKVRTTLIIHRMPQDIRTVAVIGSGVIGMGWAFLFLSQGLKVIISDPAEGAEERFKRFIHDSWPPNEGAEDQKQFLDRYEFVEDVTPRLAEADFVQEVTNPDSSMLSVHLECC